MTADLENGRSYWSLWASLVAQMAKNLSAAQGTQVPSLGREDPPEKRMAVHVSVLAWRTHGQRSLEGYSPRGRQECDTTERLTLSLVFLRT